MKIGIAEACLLSSDAPMMPPSKASPTLVVACFICFAERCFGTGTLLFLSVVGSAPALAVVAAVLALSISFAAAAAAFCAATLAARAASRFFYLSIRGSSKKWKSLW